ncbi:TetR/AcrR family transcriptional regulator [Actinophytocola sp.]|uniref:TetR/AcrR family transcriptional regulator n=1 Tax=Actinophytocola sp. TaxID=1872138 RepID=UPI002ED4041E
MGNQPSRADRILDAAGSLLLRYGYRKVTIEDISRQAGIGKGTVYLHWRTKQELFEALLRRASSTVLEELRAGLRADPAEVRPHRIVRSSFLICLRHPLVMALFTGDVEMLGQLRDSPHAGQDQAATDHTLEILTRHGLLRGDVPNLRYALSATQNGFYLSESLDPDSEALDHEAKADALAHIVRAAFEPSGKPSRRVLAAAADELGALFDNIIGEYQKWIYSDDDGETS